MRLYRVKGVLWPSLTTVLGAYQFPDDYVGESDKVKLRQAARLGTLVHKHIEQRIKGGKEKAIKDTSVATALEGFEAYRKDWPLAKETQVEQLVLSDDYKVVGRLDAVDTTRVIDWKVTGRIRSRHRWQIKGYGWLAHKTYGEVVRFDSILGEYERDLLRISYADEQVLKALVAVWWGTYGVAMQKVARDIERNGTYYRKMVEAEIVEVADGSD